MPRETVPEKVERLYNDDAVTLIDQWDDPPSWKLSVQGDTGAYTVILDENSAACDCVARGKCAHQGAARMWLERGDNVEIPEAEVVEDSGVEVEPSQVVASDSTPEHPVALAVHSGDVTEPPAELGAMLLSPIKAYRDQAWGTLSQITNPKAGMVPRQYQGNPGAALAALFLGRDWGLGPVESLQYIDVIDGSVQPSAELRLRKYRAAGHTIRIDEEADDHLTVTGTRGDNGDTLTVTYSIHDAAKMGRLQVDKDGNVKARSKTNAPMIWEKDTADMLWWGAIRRLVRRLAPDCMDRHQEDQR